MPQGGRPAPLYGNSADYINVLTAEASVYVRAHPSHYGSCVLRRAMLISTGLGLRQASIDADIWKAADAVERRRAEREALAATHGRAVGLAIYAARHSGLYLAYPLLLVPPLGLLMAMVQPQRRLLLLAACPVLYTVLTLAPYYHCERCVISAFAAALPVWALGIVALGRGAHRWLFGGAPVRPAFGAGGQRAVAPAAAA